jgi:hypothetical protein
LQQQIPRKRKLRSEHRIATTWFGSYNSSL